MLIGITNRFKEKKESWLLLLGSSLITFVNFLIISVLSHQLNPVDYGFLREVLLYTSFIVLLGTAGFSQTLYYFLNKGDSQLNKLRYLTQIRILQIGFLLSLLPVFIMFCIYTTLKNLSNITLISIFVYVCFSALTSVDLNLAIIKKRLKKYIYFNLIFLVLKLFTFYFLSKYKADISLYFVFFTFFQGLIFLGNFWVLKKDYFGSKSWEIEIDKMTVIIRYSFPLILGLSLSFLISNTDKIMLSFFCVSKYTFATISNVTLEIPFISNVYMSFFMLSLPSMIKSYHRNDIKALLEERFTYTKTVSKIIIPVVIICIVWSKEIFLTVFGGNYDGSANLFALYCSISILRFCSHHDILLATGKTKIIMWFQFAEFIFHIILSVILYKLFNVAGLILASVFTSYIYIFSVNLLSAKILKTNFFLILPFKFLAFRIVFLGISSYLLKEISDIFNLNQYWFVILVFWILSLLLYEFKNYK